MERIIVELMYWGVGVVFVDCKFFKSLWECKCNFLVLFYNKRIFNISIVVKEVYK